MKHTLLFIFLFQFSGEVFAAQPGFRKIGYFMGHRSAKADSLTHLIFAFAEITSAGICSSKGQAKQLEQVSQLRKSYPGRKFILSLGGWDGSAYFSNIVLTRESRQKFVKSCIAVMREHRFDGIDVDWEFPVSGGKNKRVKQPQDRANLVLLLREFRAQLDSLRGKKYSLSVVVPGEPSYIPHFDVRQFAHYVNWINVMGYELNEHDGDSTGHHAPLFSYSKKQLKGRLMASAEEALELYVKRGVKRQMLVLGVPFYGHVWKGVSSVNHGLFQEHMGRDATIPYREIEARYLTKAKRYFDPVAKAPWLYQEESKTMISYEDAESLRHKMDYVRKKGFGGVAIWELEQDNHEGTLLKALRTPGLARARGPKKSKR